jgi:hypothetical protein
LRVEPRLHAGRETLLRIPRAAGHGVHEEERDDRDREQHRDDPEDPPSEVVDHGLTSFVLDPYVSVDDARWAGPVWSRPIAFVVGDD